MESVIKEVLETEFKPAMWAGKMIFFWGGMETVYLLLYWKNKASC